MHRRVGRSGRSGDDEPSSSSPPANPAEEEDLTTELNEQELATLIQTIIQSDGGTTSASAPMASQSHLMAPLATPTAAAQSSDVGSLAIQILIQILGSTTPLPWLNDASARTDDVSTSSMAGDAHVSQVCCSRSSLTRQLVKTLVERLGGMTPAPDRVREQDLTQLLQQLLAQHAPLTPSTQLSAQAPILPNYTPTNFANLTFPEDDDDDPEFVPTPSLHDVPRSPPKHSSQSVAPFGDLQLPEDDEDEDDPDYRPSQQNDLADSSAWTRAVAEVVAAPTEAAAVTDWQNRPRAEPPAVPRPIVSTEATKVRRGRPRQFTAEEAAERKRTRNREHMARTRGSKRTTDAPLEHAQGMPHQHLVLEAENRFLRAELERLREENAQLRGREEMRAYVERLQKSNHGYGGL